MSQEHTEQPIVTITTRIDYEEYKRYVKHIHLKLKGLGKSALTLLLLAGLISLLIVEIKFIMVIFAKAVGEVSKAAFVKPALIGLLVGTGAFLLLYMAVTLLGVNGAFQKLKRFYKTNQCVYEADCIETFYEEYLTNHKEFPGCIDDIQFRYEYFSQGVETETAFYLEFAMDKQRHSILPKKCMTEDQITALQELFTRKYGKKFKQYNQK